MSPTAPLEASSQPDPIQSDAVQRSQDATPTAQGDLDTELDHEPEPMVRNESATVEDTRASAEKPNPLNQQGNTQQDNKSRDDDTLEQPASDEVRALHGEIESLVWKRELEALKGKLSELEARAHPISNRLSGQSSHDQENAPITPAMEVPNPQSDDYRRALESLYTHRRHWEATQGPGFWRGSYELAGGRRRHIIQGHEDEGPILPEADRVGYSRNLIRSDNEFQRPSLSNMLNDHVLEFAQKPDGAEHQFDTTIAYGKRRERLRQNFEWELDRLFMEEEMQQMRIDEAKKIRIAEEREEADEEGEPESGSEAPVPERPRPRAAEPEPTVELRYVDWYTYGDWFRARRVSAIATVEVLLGEPVDFELGPGDWSYYHGVRPLLRRRPEGFKQPSRTMNGRGQMPERVRIYSRALIAILAQVLGTIMERLSQRGESDRLLRFELPLVAVRPFKSLIYCHETLQKMAAGLEKKLTPRVDSEQVDDSITAQFGLLSEAQTHQAIVDQQDDENGGSETRSEYANVEREEDGERVEIEGYPGLSDITAPTILRHLRCLLKFLDEDVLSRREYLNDRKCSKVWFSDMDLLFPPGTHVIEKSGKQVYRVVDVRSPKHQKNPRTWAKAAPCSITCIYIDFDGKTIGPVSRNFEIPKFDGEKDITALAVYPIRFCTSWRRRDFNEAQWEKVEGLSDHLKFRHSLVARGQKFLTAAAVKQMYYTGPTLDTREDVDSQVVIDFEAALSGDNTSQKKCQPRIQSLPMIFERLDKDSTYEEDGSGGESGNESSSERGGVDYYDICRGNCCFGQDVLFEGHDLSRRRRAAFLRSLLPQAQSFNTQASIAVIPRTLGDLHVAGQPAVSEDDLLIMSFRVFGFILHNRKWGKLPQPLL